MSLTLVATLMASSAVLPTCSWNKPGQNPFMGDVVAAVDRYIDIPKPIRDALKQRMAKRQYDDVAEIKRDSIQGKKSYTNLREMHFGVGTICKTVTRKAWDDKTVERGLVYCEKGHCLIVPTVCRNVSRITQRQIDEPLEFETAAGPQKQESAPPAVDNSPLNFETAAGPMTFDPPVVNITPTVITLPSDPYIPAFPTVPSLPSLISITPAIPEPRPIWLFLVGVFVLTFLKKLGQVS